MLADHARRLLADADEAVPRTRAAVAGEEGVLRVGVRIDRVTATRGHR